MIQDELERLGHAEPAYDAERIMLLIEGTLASAATRPEARPARIAAELAAQILRLDPPRWSEAGPCAARRPAPRHDRRTLSMAVIGDVRALGAGLERSYPAYVRGRLQFRVGQIVYVAFSLDESVMGFAFPKEERAALVAGDPRKFQMPSASELRFSWGPRRSCVTGTHRGPRARRRRLARGRPQQALSRLRSRASQRPGLTNRGPGSAEP